MEARKLVAYHPGIVLRASCFISAFRENDWLSANLSIVHKHYQGIALDL